MDLLSKDELLVIWGALAQRPSDETEAIRARIKKYLEERVTEWPVEASQKFSTQL